jgi:hypothetical protein
VLNVSFEQACINMYDMNNTTADANAKHH